MRVQGTNYFLIVKYEAISYQNVNLFYMKRILLVLYESDHTVNIRLNFLLYDSDACDRTPFMHKLEYGLYGFMDPRKNVIFRFPLHGCYLWVDICRLNIHGRAKIRIQFKFSKLEFNFCTIPNLHTDNERQQKLYWII